MVSRFCFAHLQNSDRCTDQKYTKLTNAKVSPWLMSDEKPMNEMLWPEQIRHWLLFFSEVSGGQLRKNSGNHCGRLGTEPEALFFGEQVYRGMQSLCAGGAGSGERSARGSHCPVKCRRDV